MNQDPKDPRMSGRIAMFALLGLFGFTGFLIWFSA